MSKHDIPPVEDKEEEELEAGSDKTEDESVVEKNETGEPFREVEYEKFKGYLKETLEKFNPRTLNEAKKYVDDLFQKGYENEDKDYEIYQDFSEAINDLMSLKELDMEKTLDKLAQHKFFSFKKLTDEEVGIFRDFKSKDTSRSDDFDVGDLIYQLREAVTNLAEFKYPELIKEQYKQRYEAENKKDIEKAREDLNKMNVS